MPEVVAARTAAIHEAMLHQSRCIKQPNFERIGVDDLARLFDLYDEHFFDGWLTQAAKAKTPLPLKFRLSSAMTRAGGKTIRYRRRGGNASDRYEIAIASRMLFMTFGQVERPVVVCGLPCADRLQALQRIMEHEAVHLAELLVWGKSSCSAKRFKKLAAGIFGHTERVHALVTPHEHAAVQHGLRVGDTAEFEFQGRRLVGMVNRIHHRATMLVKDGKGRRYSDGKKYAKFYVPVGLLRPVR